jgi:hypothetical protein
MERFYEDVQLAGSAKFIIFQITIRFLIQLICKA